MLQLATKTNLCGTHDFVSESTLQCTKGVGSILPDDWPGVVLQYCMTYTTTHPYWHTVLVISLLNVVYQYLLNVQPCYQVKATNHPPQPRTAESCVSTLPHAIQVVVSEFYILAGSIGPVYTGPLKPCGTSS